MCQVLQKIPLVLCSRHFFSLNVSQTVFCRVSNDTNNTPAMPPFIFAYMQRPIALEHLTLLEATCCWSFSPNRKKIHGNKTFVIILLESIHISLPFLPLILHLLNPLGHVFVFHCFWYFYLYFEACFYFLLLENFVDRDNINFTL